MGQGLNPSGNDDRWKPDIVFSLRDGFIWVSWPETDAAIKLGRHEAVAGMMRDFLAQDDLGQRLNECRAKTKQASSLDPGTFRNAHAR